jgi:hypothetical protein
MSDKELCFTGTVAATRDVTVFAETASEAAETIRKLYESGDACAEVTDVQVINIRQTDVDGNDLLDGYLFFDDETATMCDTPSLTGLPANLTELTDDHIREVFIDFISDYTQPKITPEEVMGWSAEKATQAMWSVHTLMLNKVALIHPRHRETIRKAGDALGECCGSDSSTYTACKAFNTMLQGLAVSVIDFPEYNSEEEDDISVLT